MFSSNKFEPVIHKVGSNNKEPSPKMSPIDAFACIPRSIIRFAAQEYKA